MVYECSWCREQAAYCSKERGFHGGWLSLPQIVGDHGKGCCLLLFGPCGKHYVVVTDKHAENCSILFTWEARGELPRCWTVYCCQRRSELACISNFQKMQWLTVENNLFNEREKCERFWKYIYTGGEPLVVPWHFPRFAIQVVKIGQPRCAYPISININE